MGSLFRLPDDAIISDVEQKFPGRGHQIRALAALLHPDGVPARNLVVYGSEATGKTAVTRAVLSQLAAPHAYVNALQCITGRHLFERIVAAVAAALDRPDSVAWRCESLAQLAVSLGSLLAPLAQKRDAVENGDHGGASQRRFILLLDAIDRQREAPPTLLPALARMSEIMPSLTCVFIVTTPPDNLLRTAAAASSHLHFPPYSKTEFIRILALEPPPPVAGTTPSETAELWTRFCAAVHDALVRSAARTLPAFRRSCRALWPRFTAPVAAGVRSPKDFSRLLIAARVHFQDESLLNPSIVAVRLPTTAAAAAAAATASNPASNPSSIISAVAVLPPQPAAELVGLLPIVARLLLLAAYLASHNAARHDLTLFSTHHHGRRRRRRGGAVSGQGTPRAKHRKIARKLLGAHAFVLERMLAVFEAVRGEWAPEGSSSAVIGGGGDVGLDGDVGMALATLASLRLLVRVGAGDVTDRSGKWRINASWEVVRGIGRSLGVEVEEWLIE